jgi:hypothetical protein
MFAKIFFLCTFIGCLIGGMFLFMAVTSANGAPQEAAGAAIAVAFAVIPYCFARSIQEMGKGIYKNEP